MFAAYSDLFQPPGAQGGTGGPTETSEQDAVLTLGLLEELVEQQLAVVTDESDRLLLLKARTQLRPVGTPEGPGNLARIGLNVITTLLEWGPLRRAGQWTGARLMRHHLEQVSRYLNRGEPVGPLTLDQRIRARVRAALGPAPAVVVAHSLGTVVAFETLHEFLGAVPLFVTLGSRIPEVADLHQLRAPADSPGPAGGPGGGRRAPTGTADRLGRDQGPDRPRHWAGPALGVPSPAPPQLTRLSTAFCGHSVDSVLPQNPFPGWAEPLLTS